MQEDLEENLLLGTVVAQSCILVHTWRELCTSYTKLDLSLLPQTVSLWKIAHSLQELP